MVPSHAHNQQKYRETARNPASTIINAELYLEGDKNQCKYK